MASGEERAGTPSALLVRAGRHVCALAVTEVIEILRPLPVETLTGAPDYVPGITILRGSPVAVVHLASLLGFPDPCRPARFVALRVGVRTLVLAVDAVLGLRRMAEATLVELPPLLEGTSAERIQELGVLDSELLMVLNSARLIPEDVWDAIAGTGAAA